jgi:MFS family permease
VSGGGPTDEPEHPASGSGETARINGNVFRWLIAFAFSMVGDSAYFFALSWAAAQSGSPAEVGLVLGIGAVPRAILMLGGGVVVDRFGPRTVALASDSMRFLIIAGLSAVLVLATPGLWILILVAVLFGVVDAFFMPAVGALPQAICEPHQLVRVQGLRVLVIRTGNTVGPPLAGAILSWGGSAAAFSFIAVLFGASLLLLWHVRIVPLEKPPVEIQPTGEHPAEQAGPGRQLVAGFAYIRSRPVIASLVLTLAMVEIGSIAPLNLGLLLLADENGWGPAGAGWAIAAFGAGAGVSALVLTLLGAVRRAGVTYLISLLVGAAGIAGLAYDGGLLAFIVTSGLIGVALGLNGALAYAFIQHETDPAFIGRVMSVVSVVSFGIGPVGYPMFGALIGVVGLPMAFLCCSGILMVGIVLGVRSAAVRSLTLPSG